MRASSLTSVSMMPMAKFAATCAMVWRLYRLTATLVVVAFAIIPPQTQLEIRQKKKLLFCENCGRMLVDQSFFAEFEQAHDVERV